MSVNHLHDELGMARILKNILECLFYGFQRNFKVLLMQFMIYKKELFLNFATSNNGYKRKVITMDVQRGSITIELMGKAWPF